MHIEPPGPEEASPSGPTISDPTQHGRDGTQATPSERFLAKGIPALDDPLKYTRALHRLVPMREIPGRLQIDVTETVRETAAAAGTLCLKFHVPRERNGHLVILKSDGVALAPWENSIEMIQSLATSCGAFRTISKKVYRIPAGRDESVPFPVIHQEIRPGRDTLVLLIHDGVGSGFSSGELGNWLHQEIRSSSSSARIAWIHPWPEQEWVRTSFSILKNRRLDSQRQDELVVPVLELERDRDGEAGLRALEGWFEGRDLQGVRSRALPVDVIPQDIEHSRSNPVPDDPAEQKKYWSEKLEALLDATKPSETKLMLGIAASFAGACSAELLMLLASQVIEKPTDLRYSIASAITSGFLEKHPGFTGAEEAKQGPARIGLRFRSKEARSAVLGELDKSFIIKVIDGVEALRGDSDRKIQWDRYIPFDLLQQQGEGGTGDVVLISREEAEEIYHLAERPVPWAAPKPGAGNKSPERRVAAEAIEPPQSKGQEKGKQESFWKRWFGRSSWKKLKKKLGDRLEADDHQYVDRFIELIEEGSLGAPVDLARFLLHRGFDGEARTALQEAAKEKNPGAMLELAKWSWEHGGDGDEARKYLDPLFIEDDRKWRSEVVTLLEEIQPHRSSEYKTWLHTSTARHDFWNHLRKLNENQFATLDEKPRIDLEDLSQQVECPVEGGKFIIRWWQKKVEIIIQGDADRLKAFAASMTDLSLKKDWGLDPWQAFKEREEIDSKGEIAYFTELLRFDAIEAEKTASAILGLFNTLMKEWVEKARVSDSTLAVDSIVNHLVTLGAPGVVLLIMISTSGLAGAAALTSTLAVLGGPLGMLGGIGVLGILGLLSKAGAKHGAETILRRYIEVQRQEGRSVVDLKNQIKKMPLTASQKHKVLQYLEDLEEKEIKEEEDQEQEATTREGTPHEVELIRQQADAGDEEAMLELGERYLRGDHDLEKDAKLGLYWLRKIANAKCPSSHEAMRRLAYWLLDAKIEEDSGGLVDPSRAGETRTKEGQNWLSEAAREGDPAAMEFLGQRLLEGIGFEKDLEEGRSWLRKAAETEEPQVMRILGDRLLDGDGFEQDLEGGRSWLQKAAEAEEPAAMMSLGDRLLDGDGFEQDVEEGRSWLQKAAEAEEPQAMKLLGDRLLDGVGFERDLEEGGFWLRLAAEAEEPQAMGSLGSRLLNGDGFEQDVEEGRAWLLRAAVAEDPHAMKLLGDRLLLGIGFEQDLEGGRSWLQKAAEAEEPAAMMSLGNRLLNGDGFEQDLEEGRTWLRKAAEAEEPQAMKLLGDRLLDGVGFERDLEEGRSWLRKASDAEDPAAMASLGHRLLDGVGFERDLEEGGSWLRKAAETEDPQTMRILGSRLLDGDGFKQDVEEGRAWLLRAAEAEEPVAMAVLGSRLLGGDGFEQDLEEGRSWLRKAAEAGHEEAEALLVKAARPQGREGMPPREDGAERIRVAAEAGDEEAMLELGERNLRGDHDLEKNAKVGLYWLRKVANAKSSSSAKAMGRLAHWLLEEEVVVDRGLGDPSRVAEVSKKEGLNWLRKAAEAEDPDAMTSLGTRLLKGDGFEQDVEESRSLLRKAAELAGKVEVHATGHDKMAQLWKDNPLLKETLPILALLNPVGPVNLDTLRSIIVSRAPEFEALTERGKLHGELEVVRHQLSGYVISNYLLENDGFVQFILEGGFHWVDSDWKKEQLNILRHFHVHIEKDEERYSKLLEQVVSSPWSGQITRAELETALGSQETSTGHIDAMKKVLRRLPEQYRDQDLIGVLCSVAVPFEGDYLRDPGASVPSEDTELKLPNEMVLESLVGLAFTMLDYPKLQVTAVRILKLLAGIGDIQAMFFLGDCLLEGDGFEKDVEEGRSWLRKAAETDDPQSMRSLGTRLLAGDGFEKDVEEGRSWLRKAAETEDPDAMRILGTRLLEGDGFEKDLEEGRSWLRRAAEAEDDSGQDEDDRIASHPFWSEFFRVGVPLHPELEGKSPTGGPGGMRKIGPTIAPKIHLRVSYSEKRVSLRLHTASPELLRPLFADRPGFERAVVLPSPMGGLVKRFSWSPGTPKHHGVTVHIDFTHGGSVWSSEEQVAETLRAYGKIKELVLNQGFGEDRVQRIQELLSEKQHELASITQDHKRNQSRYEELQSFEEELLDKNSDLEQLFSGQVELLDEAEADVVAAEIALEEAEDLQASPDDPEDFHPEYETEVQASEEVLHAAEVLREAEGKVEATGEELQERKREYEAMSARLQDVRAEGETLERDLSLVERTIKELKSEISNLETQLSEMDGISEENLDPVSGTDPTPVSPAEGGTSLKPEIANHPFWGDFFRRGVPMHPELDGLTPTGNMKKIGPSIGNRVQIDIDWTGNGVRLRPLSTKPENLRPLLVDRETFEKEVGVPEVWKDGSEKFLSITLLPAPKAIQETWSTERLVTETLELYGRIKKYLQARM